MVFKFYYKFNPNKQRGSQTWVIFSVSKLMKNKAYFSKTRTTITQLILGNNTFFRYAYITLEIKNIVRSGKNYEDSKMF